MISAMTIISLIHTGHLLTRRKKLKELFVSFLTIELFLSLNRINRGYFLRFETSLIEIDDYYLGILFILSIIIILRNRRFDTKILLSTITLCGTVIIGISKMILSPEHVYVVPYGNSWDLYVMGYQNQMTSVTFSAQGLLMFLRLIIFLSILVACKYELKLDNWFLIGKKIINASKLVLVFCIFEIYIKYFLHSEFLSNFLDGLMGKSYYLATGTTRLQGLSLEPSYLSIAIFNFILLSFILHSINNTNNSSISYYYWNVVAIIVGLFSGSFSFVMVCFSWIMIFLSYRISRKVFNLELLLKYFIIMNLILMGGFFVFSNSFIEFVQRSNFSYLHRLGNSVRIFKILLQNSNLSVGSLLYNSETTRMMSIVETFKAYLFSPIFGLGIGSAYCTSGIVCILSNIGIIGFIIWIYILFVLYVPTTKNEKYIVLLILLPMIFGGDLYLLYNTSLLILIPLYSFILSNRKVKKECEIC